MPKPRFRWSYLVGGLLILGIGTFISLYYYAERIVEQRLRPATIALLERRFDSTVELAAMHVTLTPQLSVRGEGLVLRHQGRTDIPPLITIREFTIEGRVQELWARRVDRVHLDGLEIMIPPRRGEDMPDFATATSGKPAEARDPDGAESTSSDDGSTDVYIRELVADNSLLTITPKVEGKDPRVFQIRDLRFEDFELGSAIPFMAALTNPTPHGEIATKGTFGPWDAERPSLTPIDGTFLFDADLGTINGIGGALHAEGKFSGPLEMIRTSGRTRTEGFHLSSGGTKFPLVVNYDAIVDGTNGDTILERVNGVLGQSTITARGKIVKDAARSGRRITLDTTTEQGRLEEFVMLTTRTQSSPLTGLVDVEATLELPPGGGEVIDRIDLAGSFHVAEAQFTSDTIQKRVDELARRGVGRPEDETIVDVASNFRGSFRLRNARLELDPLTFRVDGAAVRLAGHYDTKAETMNFRGELRLQARASQTQTGWKRFVLKLFDPLLDGRGAGTVLPISITGTRAQPKFSADIKKAILK